MNSPGASPAHTGWRWSEVVSAAWETPRVRTLWVRVPGWNGHLPGQHVDVRLTAEDGYRAHRSYSIASAPSQPMLALTVEHLPGGEVSPYLTQLAAPGDRFEVRGPIGGYFVWEPPGDGPMLLLAGGSGAVPLMAIVRHRATLAHRPPCRWLSSCRSAADAVYGRELAALAAVDEGLHVRFTLTRGAPPGWRGFTRRLDTEMLREVAWPASARPTAFVCGSSGFVDAAADGLAGLGYAPERIRTERFGPTGDA